MAGFIYKGIVLQQRKEPALSRDLREFFNADTIGVQMPGEPVADVDALTPMQILKIARQANIVDERDGKTLVEKINIARGQTLHTLVGDAIDDEPYISSQLNPLLKNQALAAAGLRLLQKATFAKKAFFAVYKNLSDLEIKIPRTIEGFPVKRIRGHYPAEYQASRAFFRDESSLLVGVGALIHLARAVIYNKPQSTTFVTVAGDCIGNPTNLEVSLGMTIMQVLERCGLIDDPSRVIIGGSMTGIGVIDTEHTIVTPTTRAILAFREDIGSQAYTCIGCCRCVHVCPKGLNPFFLYRSAKANRIRDFRNMDPQMCIGCNSCSYICPAKLDLSETIRQGLRTFESHIASMESQRAEQSALEDAKYQDYYAAYQLRMARRADRRAHRRLDQDSRRLAKQAQKTRSAAESACVRTYEQDCRRIETEKEQAISRATAAQSAALKNAQAKYETDTRQAQAKYDAELKQAAQVRAEALKPFQDALKPKRGEEQSEEARLTAQQALEQATLEADAAYQAVQEQSLQVLEDFRVEALKICESAKQQAQDIFLQAQQQALTTYAQSSADAKMRRSQGMQDAKTQFDAAHDQRTQAYADTTANLYMQLSQAEAAARQAHLEMLGRQAPFTFLHPEPAADMLADAGQPPADTPADLPDAEIPEQQAAMQELIKTFEDEPADTLSFTDLKEVAPDGETPEETVPEGAGFGEAEPDEVAAEKEFVQTTAAAGNGDDAHGWRKNPEETTISREAK